jgi:molybdopterin converting factor small subunit
LAVTEPQRLALHAAARATLGAEEGDTLMALTPPANTEIATLQALEHTEERLGSRIDNVEERLGSRIDTVEERLTARIDTVEERLGSRIDTVEERLGSRIDNVEERLTARIERVDERSATRIDQAVSGLRVDIERTASRTLRWSVGAIVAAQAATVGSLTLLLG